MPLVSKMITKGGWLTRYLTPNNAFPLFDVTKHKAFAQGLCSAGKDQINAQASQCVKFLLPKYMVLLGTTCLLFINFFTYTVFST